MSAADEQLEAREELLQGWQVFNPVQKKAMERLRTLSQTLDTPDLSPEDIAAGLFRIFLCNLLLAIV